MAINREVRVDFVGTDRTKAASSSVVAGIKRVNKEIDGIATRAVAAQRAFSALTIGFAGVNAIRTLGDLQESMLRVQNTSLDYARDQQFLSKTTRALNLDLQAAASAYADILVLQNTGFIGGNQAQDLFVGFQESAKKFGVEAQDVKFAIRGIRQALGAGVVRAQEFDQIFDAISPVMNDVAKNLGITNTELLELRTASTLSSQALLDALIPALLQSEGAAASAADNINASLTNLSSSYKRALLAFQEPIGDAVGDFAQIAGEAIDGLVASADKIKYVGIAIAAAFGGRALNSLIAVGDVYADNIKRTREYARETAVLSQATAEKAASELAAARATQASAAARAAEYAAQAKGLKNWQAQTAFAKAYRGSLAEVAAATRTVETAGKAASVATSTLAASQRAARTSSILFASALTKLKDVLKANAAFAVLGGLLLIASRVREGTKEIREMQSALDDLDARSATIGQRAFDETVPLREELEIKLYKLQKDRFAVQLRINEAKEKEAQADASLKNYGRQLVANEEKAYAKLTAQIKEGAAAMQELIDRQDEFTKDDLIAKYYRSIADAFDKTYRQVADPRGGIPGLIEDFFPSKGKLQDLKARLAEAEKAFTRPSDKENRNNVISAIKEEIKAVEASFPATKRYTEEKEKNKKALDALNLSLLTERERIEKTFKDANLELKIGLKLGNVDRSTADAMIEAVAAQQAAADKRLNQAERDRLEQHRKDMKEVREKVVQDRLEHNNRLIAAQIILDPLKGEAARFRQEVLDLHRARGEGQAATDLYYKEVQARYKLHLEEMDRIRGEITKNASSGWISQKQNAENQLLGQIASNFVSAFEQQVGAYQTLNDNMTDIDRKSAIESNKINKKKFEQNKKFAIAQAIISTLTGASNALTIQPTWPLGVALAASVMAMGMRNVANIRSTSFGSGGSVSTGGGAPALTAAVEPEVVAGSSERVIMIVAGNFQSEEEAMAEVARRQRDAYQQGLINSNPDGSPDFRNVPDRVVRLR